MPGWLALLSFVLLLLGAVGAYQYLTVNGGPPRRRGPRAPRHP